MQRHQPPSFMQSVASLFGNSAKVPSPDTKAECINTLAVDHHVPETDAAKLVQGLTETDLDILLHLISAGDSPSAARKKIDDNDIDVVEMRTIESPSQHMRK